jgi:hypothetical protein
MFQTDLILWLQASSPDWMLPLMLFVSELGSDGIYTPVMLALIFAWRVRPGLRVLLALLLAGLLVNAAKEGFALPRPVDVDSRLLRKGEANTAIVDRGAATSFWARPPADAVQAVRTAATDSGVGRLSDGAYAALGLPDAHVAAFAFAALGYAVALLGTMFIAPAWGWYSRSPGAG